MVNPFKEVNWNPGLAEKRKFAMSLMIGFPCLAVLALVAARIAKHSWDFKSAFWLGGVGVIMGVLFWAIPVVVKPFYIAWYCIACSIGVVVSNLLLISFFLLVITPAGIAMRLAGRRPLKRLRRNTSTYWDDAEQISNVQRYYRQF